MTYTYNKKSIGDNKPTNGNNYMYKKQCYCSDTELLAPKKYDNTGKYKCTVPVTDTPATDKIQSCDSNAFAMSYSTCNAKQTKETCVGNGTSGKPCAWYDPSNGADDGGTGVCYDPGTSGFFANCDSNGYMCRQETRIPNPDRDWRIKDLPSHIVTDPGSMNCRKTWIPTNGYEACTCNGVNVKWDSADETQYPPQQCDSVPNNPDMVDRRRVARVEVQDAPPDDLPPLQLPVTLRPRSFNSSIKLFRAMDLERR